MGYRAPICFAHKLVLNRCLSSILSLAALVLLLGTIQIQAHEIRPAIADVTVSGNSVAIEIRLTLESLVANLDLSDLEDTNASPLAAQYDALRALPPEQLETAFRDAWPDIRGGFSLSAGDTRLTLDIAGLTVEPIGDLALSRESMLQLSAQLPNDDSAITFGWQASFGPLVVRQVLPTGDGYSGYLTNGELSEAMPRGESAKQPWLTVFADFVGIGFIHIVPRGLDHILFVLGLFFFSLKLRPILTQVTAFTIAHTVTLATASLGIISIPASIVEPLIAASIVYVAVENILLNELRPWRTAVVFGFGLLHGLGFASVLGDIGLDPGRFFTGLIGFNLGVELGQLTVITGAFLTVGYWFGAKPWYGAVIARPVSLGIAIVGAYWFIQRVFF